MTYSPEKSNSAQGGTPVPNKTSGVPSTSLADRGRDEILKLKDGRSLAVRHYGDEQGLPVAFFHGWPGSRLEAALGDAPATAAGIHLIGFDRPGFGLSDHKPGRTFGSWPADVAEAMSLLGAPRFGVIGVSGGGPFALACAERIPNRLTGVAFVSGAPSHDAPGIPQAFRRNMVIFKIGRYLRFVPRVLLWMMNRKQRKNPNDMLEYLLPRVPPSDRAILERPEVAEALRIDQLEAYRNGTKGPLLESRLLVTRWDFRPEDISIKVHVWQGDADIQVSVESARYLLRQLRNGVGHFIAGGGHYFVVDGFPEILAAATEGARP